VLRLQSKYVIDLLLYLKHSPNDVSTSSVIQNAWKHPF